jgi:hypothetical protein
MSRPPIDRSAALAAVTLLCGAGAFWIAFVAFIGWLIS